MFVNKISGFSNLGFKGYQHVKNDVGETVMRFNYPYDSNKENCEIQIFRVRPTDKYNYKIIESPIASVQLKPEGVDVNLQELTALDQDEPFAYKVVKKDKVSGNVVWEGPDTGVKMKPENGEFVYRTNCDKNQKHQVKDKEGHVIDTYEDYEDSMKNYKYTIVSRKGTTPLVQGAGYLITPDSFMPGAKFKGFDDPNTGDIYYDKDFQKEMEGVVKTFSNIHGGSIAGLQKAIPELKKSGYKYIFTTPIANGSKGWSLGYWNKNNMQVSENMGNSENFAAYFKELFANGMKYVNDGTFTSEGLEGIHFQYALRWAEENPQTYHWFRMSGLKDSNLGLGIIPKNKENLRHRVVNAPYNYELQSDGVYKKVVNPNYNPNKETLFQIYDVSQASEKQLKDLDNAIVNYEKISDGNALDIVNHDDTVINYVFQIEPKEYDNRIKVINELNKKFGKNIRLDSPNGTIMAGQFSNFKIDKKTEGGFVTWDANTDMVKMNYHISGYDEKLLQAIPERSEREYEQQLMERGAREVQDMAIQSGKYWTNKVKKIQTVYAARTIRNAKTVEELDKLINQGKLPQEAKISSAVLNNILNANYLLEPKGILDSDDVTVKALMSLPLDAIELGDNTVGVLSTSYFSNRATTDDTIGVSRFELMKNGNPHLVEPYASTYNKVNSLYNNELKNFADQVIRRMNESSNEKLVDSSGDYTEYGEYVIEHIAQDIVKYAILKSLAGNDFKTKILSDGDITYDYDAIKESTSLSVLRISAHNPTEEANALYKKISSGVSKLDSNDINYLVEAFSKKLAGTDTMSFRIAEAMVDRSGLGLDWRLDAAKDVMDMDAVRNEDNSFDDNWNDVINFWAKFVQGIKSENPNSYIVAEITDIPDLMKDTYGDISCPYKGQTNIGQKFNGEPDAFAKFFDQTGITSEAGYSYFFTDLLTSFAPSFDTGDGTWSNHDRFFNRFDLLLETRSADYLRNLYTFMGNHDKPRTIHGMAVDMPLFHANLLHNYEDMEQGRKFRTDAIKVLSGANSMNDVPIELRLNVDNNDYFLLANNKAIAMSKLLMDVIYNDINNVISDNDKKRLIDALVDLTNGNYLGQGVTDNLNKINIKELTSLSSAFNEILSIAESEGLNLSETDKSNLIKSVVEIANNKDMDSYLVHGGYNWESLEQKYRDYNNNQAKKILGDRSDYSMYSLYAVQLANLLRDSYLESNLQSSSKDAINKAFVKFVEKYNQDLVSSKTSQFRTFEDTADAMRKNGYAVRDIKLAIAMAVKQAEYKSGTPIQNKQAIIDEAYKMATEPAVAKTAMLSEFLKALMGIPTTYSGDEYGMTGYEEKAKNMFLQNRNVLPHAEAAENTAGGIYRRTVKDVMTETIKDRADSDLAPLNNGTPYRLEVKANSYSRSGAKFRLDEIDKEISHLQTINDDASKSRIKDLENEKLLLNKDFAKFAYLMQNADGDMTVSLMDSAGVDFSNRFDYFKAYGLDSEEKRKKFFEDNNIDSINEHNKYVPITGKSELDAILLTAGISIPVGTIFMNVNLKDRAEYVVQDLGGKLGIVKKDGGKIVMDGKTAKNGVMILKKIKKVVFKGAPADRALCNTHYNLVSNPYAKKTQSVDGQKLSILSK